MTIKHLEAYDPGKTTGYAWFRFSDTQPLVLEKFGQIEDGVEGFIRRDYPMFDADIVISESFVLDGRTIRPNLEPLKIEGVLMADAYALQHELVFQRNNFKTHVDDARLKDIGWYQKGMPHANDAIRHGLAWAKLHHRPTLDAYFRDTVE